MTPRAAQNRVWRDAGGVRVSVTAAPTDCEANAAVIELLAKRLGIAKSRVELVRGTTSRQKRFRFVGMAEAEILSAIPAESD
ncbi:MAG: DUF167 domain-containing protein [Fimbriimonadaceae bacterium]|nr:DUF167 domain-containing protein [Fimbriimonadaceae bacterium]